MTDLFLPALPESVARTRRGTTVWRGAATLLLIGILSDGMVPARAGETVPAVAATTDEVARPADDPRNFVQFIHEDDTNCQLRDGKKILVQSSHPNRRIRVWLDRFYQNVGTGDRSRSDLLPAAEPEALGCDTVMNGVQEWRIARALFLD